MIKIENVEVYGWEAAIRGMRNPMNSWGKSDSSFGCTVTVCSECPYVSKDSRDSRGNLVCKDNYSEGFHIGDNDKRLMMQLAKAGTEHAKYLRMINVTLDIIAPLYWWKEADTYKIGTVANSCSTMHKIHSKEFTYDDFSSEHLMLANDINDQCLSILVDIKGNETYCVSPNGLLTAVISCLNNYRKRYLETKDKEWWWQMVQLLPSSYNQRRTVQLNYAVLSGIYRQRKDHKLDEWRDFCKWVESLPYSELVTGGEKE